MSTSGQKGAYDKEITEEERREAWRNPDFYSLQLIAISSVTRQLLQESLRGKSSRNKNLKKVPLFHDAIRAEIGSGAPELIPHEIIRDEYRLMHHYIKRLRKEWRAVWEERWKKKSVKVKEKEMPEWLSTVTVSTTISHSRSSDDCIFRPCPIPDRLLSETVWDFGSMINNCDIAEKVTAERLLVSASTVNDAPTELTSASVPKRWRKKPRVRKRKNKPDKKVWYRIRPSSKTQCLLASLFIDLCHASSTLESRELQASILNSLLASGQHPLVIHYLSTFAAERFNRSAPILPDYKKTEIHKACTALQSSASGVYPDLLRLSPKPPSYIPAKEKWK